jgi:DNA replication protein DnaC
MLSKKPQMATLPANSLKTKTPPKCPKCDDREFIITDKGAIPCECRKQRTIERNVKSSMVDKSFSEATFENYKTLPHTREMYETAKKYALHFNEIRRERANGLMFAAKVGETRIREAGARRAEMRRKHNSYGLGKTHLLSAIANALLPQGVQVVFVNDTDMVAELRQGQLAEIPDRFEGLVHKLENAELLIWDDLGKAKTTDWVLNQYYRIFNYRYRQGLPVCISTNEDIDSLAERVGDATASRLYAICKPRLVVCEGPDYRLRHELEKD